MVDNQDMINAYYPLYACKIELAEAFFGSTLPSQFAANLRSTSGQSHHL